MRATLLGRDGLRRAPGSSNAQTPPAAPRDTQATSARYVGTTVEKSPNSRSDANTPHQDYSKTGEAAVAVTPEAAAETAATEAEEEATEPIAYAWGR